MALAHSLAPLYAEAMRDAELGPSEVNSGASLDFCIVPLLGAFAYSPVRCHAALLRARCSALLQTPKDCTSLQVEADRETVLALLQWVYCEVVQAEAAQDMDAVRGLGPRLVRLGRSVGLRDAGRLQARVAAQSKASRAQGMLAEDLLRAYDNGDLHHGLRFQPIASAEDPSAPLLDGGWSEVLKARSEYFAAMLGGTWAESSRSNGEVVICVHWPHDQMKRLVRFLHGAPFIECDEDVASAVECAKFFGVPSLFASINDFIAERLQPSTAPMLWNLLEIESQLRDGDTYDFTANADEACFDYHIANFHILAEGLQQDDGKGPVPLHDLSYSLMRRLLSSGLVDMPTRELKAVVKRFSKARTEGKPYEAYQEMWQSLCPPELIFNRVHRQSLLPRVDLLTARSFV